MCVISRDVYIWKSTNVPAFPIAVCLSISLIVYPLVYSSLPSFSSVLSVCPSLCLFANLPVCLSTSPSVHPPVYTCLSVFHFIFLSVCPFVCLTICLSVILFYFLMNDRSLPFSVCVRARVCMNVYFLSVCLSMSDCCPKVSPYFFSNANLNS